MHNFFVVAAAILEFLRIVVLSREIKQLALEKGEPPMKWMLGTILVWWGIELAVVLAWFFIYGWDLSIVIAIFLGIVTARVVFYFFKKELQNKKSGSIEDRIDEIGRED